MTIAVLLLKATAILVMALLATRLLSGARASVRHAVLAATFVVLAALPFATLMLPVVEFPVLPGSAGRASIAAGLGFSRGISRRIEPEGGFPSSSEGASRAVSDGPVVTGLANGIPIEFALLGIWLTGTSAVLLSLSVGLYRVHRLRRAALPCLETQRHLPVLAHAAGVGRAVDVVVHEEITAPLTCGILRPAIVLPPDTHDWPGAALTRALVHELEHVKRRDWAVQITARAVCALYWFHPLAWMAYRQLCLQAEHACDDAVVTREEDTMYADQLVTLARRMAARPAIAVLGMANRSDLAVRVSAVLDASRPRGPAGAVRASAIAASALVLLVALAPLQLVAASVERAVDASGTEAEADLVQGDRASAARLRAEAANAARAELRTKAAASARAEQQRRAGRLDRVLVEAADEGDLGDVRELLDGGANVNAAVDGDGSPLIAAARGGHREIVQLLLDRGADVNLGVPGDGAPLIMAAREGHLTIAQLLLDRGATVDLIVAGDENALIQASGSGQLEMVKLLVAHGANVNARIWVERVFDRSGGEWRTPLSMAARGGHRAVADVLRSAGAVE